MGVDCNACHHGQVNFRTGQLLQRLRLAFPTTALYSQIILSKEGGVKSHVVLSLGCAHDMHHVNNRPMLPHGSSATRDPLLDSLPGEGKAAVVILLERIARLNLSDRCCCYRFTVHS